MPIWHHCDVSTIRSCANKFHDDVIKWKPFPRSWPFVRGIHRSPVNSPHKGQWRGALLFSLICSWINGWVNNIEASDLRRHRAHYDVTVMYNAEIQQRSWPIPPQNHLELFVSIWLNYNTGLLQKVATLSLHVLNTLKSQIHCTKSLTETDMTDMTDKIWSYKRYSCVICIDSIGRKHLSIWVTFKWHKQIRYFIPQTNQILK